MIDFSALWQREWQIKQQNKVQWLYPLVLFLIIFTLFPLAMGSEPKLLQQLDELFQENHEIKFTYSENSTSKTAYSLVKLKAFIPDDDLALKEVLHAFVKNTHESLLTLRKGINTKDLVEIKEISHRMYPMFQQIEATEIAFLLHKMSNESLNLPVSMF